MGGFGIPACLERLHEQCDGRRFAGSIESSGCVFLGWK